MPKHSTVTLTLAEVVDKIEENQFRDIPWYSVMQIRELCESMKLWHDSEEIGESPEFIYFNTHADDVYQVQWPEHVLVPMFNGDAIYHKVI